MLDVVEQCRAADAAAHAYDAARRAHQRAAAAAHRAQADDAFRAERTAWRALVAARDAWQTAWRAAETEQAEQWANAQAANDDQQGTLL